MPNKNKNTFEERVNKIEINQIRPEQLDDLAKKAYDKDLIFYKSSLHLFVERACPACSLESKTTFLVKDSFNFSKCPGCSCIYMNPGPTEELVNDFYQTSENYKFWAEHMYPQSRLERLRTIHQERAEWVLDFLSKKLPERENFTILELGAGSGDTLTSILNYNSLKILGFATEPNPSMGPHLQSNGIKVITSLELSTNEYIGKFDAVVCFEVLEHLLEPSKILSSVHSNLKVGGYFFASTPNAQSIEVQLLKEKSTTVDIEHISVLTPASIYVLGMRNNFRVLEISTPGFFDLELIKRGGANCSVTQREQILGNTETQDFIRNSGLASHIKCILMKS